MKKTEKIKLNAHLIIFVALIIGCEAVLSPEPEDDMNTSIYFNSFESANDTIGWRGYGAMEFNSDAPHGGGNQSIYIAGGCIHPHAYLGLDPLSEDRRLIIQCWGKNLAIGGSVTLSTTTFENRIYIYIGIDSTDWVFYESIDTLELSADDTLRLSMSSGGFAPSAMLVDLVKIVRVD